MVRGARVGMGRRQLVRFFGPVLRAIEELGGEAPAGMVRQRVADDLKIPNRQQDELMPGGSSRFGNQIAWARFHLAKAGLIDSPRRGVWRITDRGRAQLGMSEEEADAIARRVGSETRRKTVPEDRASQAQNS